MGLAGSQAKGSAVRLRTIARAANIALATFALVACGALVALTTLLRRDAENMKEVSESARSVDSLRVDLLSFGRASALAFMTRNPAHAQGRDQIEATLLEGLEQAQLLARQPAQHLLLATGARQIHDYLAARKEREARGGSLQEIMLDTSPALESALDTLGQLSRKDFEAVEAAQRHAARWDKAGNILGVSIAVLMLIGFLAVAIGTRRWVFAPLLAIGDAIDRFAAGDASVRIGALGGAEFGRTANGFNEMAVRLGRQREDLLTFLAGVAHDLRNPLAALRMSIRFLEPGHPLPPEEKLRKTLELIDRQVMRLERMVADFLDACRIEGGHLELDKQRRDLRLLAHDVVELYEPASFSHKLLLSVDDTPVLATCDSQRIAQVLNNLVSNAIKYSPGGGDVLVSVTRERGDAVISVSDHGMGISPADFAHIFEPFRRTGASRDAVPGVGLGLSVSRRIVEAHGGRIEVESTIGVGSTFRVHLPMAGLLAYEPLPSLH